MKIRTTLPEIDVTTPLDSGIRAQGAGEIRKLKTDIQTRFPNLNSPVRASSDLMNSVFRMGGFPIGLMMAWAFSLDDKPEGWALCDGQVHNGIVTPDTVGKSLLGGFVQEELGEKVGQNTISFTDVDKVVAMEDTTLTLEQLARHNHGFVANEGDEDEDVGVVKQFISNAQGQNSDGKIPGINTVGGEEHVYEEWRRASIASKGGGGSHGHKFAPTASSEEGYRTYDNRPESFKLYWLMFVGIPDKEEVS